MVLLVGPWAVKLPQVHYGWRNFLFGLLANHHEVRTWALRWPELCPVVASLPGGWLLVMPRCEEFPDTAGLPEEARAAIEAAAADGRELPGERKSTSWGRLHGRAVVFDYGEGTF